MPVTRDTTLARVKRVIRRELLPIPATDREFLTQCYRGILGREPDRLGLRRKALQLRSTATRGDVVISMVRSGEYVGRTVAAALAGTGAMSNEEFLHHAYRRLLLREPDPGGLRSYGRLLARGQSRAHVLGALVACATRAYVLRALVASDEHVNRVAAAVYDLPDLTKVRPEAYEYLPDRSGAGVPTFHASDPADFDWVEQAILDNGYYDKPGVWGSEVNLDKRVMAEMVACLEPRRVLDFGCASGAVLLALDDLGIRGEGVEISAAAVGRAERRVRSRIYVGDLLDVELSRPYDVVFGLDIYEHLSPNRLDTYIARVAKLVTPGGFAFCNIPAFGEDEVFGTVFPRALPVWDEAAEQGCIFTHLPVDEEGYPHHGHLVWAESSWWVERWERVGLRRERELEAALHHRYGAHLERTAPARRSFFVFSRDRDPARVTALADTISTTPSAAIAEGMTGRHLGRGSAWRVVVPMTQAEEPTTTR